jgi:phenylacetate-coenzyme A ligase PaaK-like adenylate-forming protein
VVLSVQVDAVALYRLRNSYLIDPLLLLEDVIIPEKITHLTATPSVFATLVPLLESFKHQDKLTLRHASAGGETFSADLGVRLPAVGFQAIVNFYGPTETSISSDWFRCHCPN